jgi:short-subunit dehydrogenase
MELELNGKVALVTGANRGIGAAIATELAREGMHLCLVARDSAKLRDVADSLANTANISVQVIPADLRDPAAPAQAIAQAVGHFGRLDLLVNNAGGNQTGGFLHTHRRRLAGRLRPQVSRLRENDPSGMAALALFQR